MPSANKIAGFFKMLYLKKEVGDEVYFWHEHRSFLEDDSITFGVRSQSCPKFPKQPIYNNFAISQRKRER